METRYLNEKRTSTIPERCKMLKLSDKLNRRLIEALHVEEEQKKKRIP